jgi:hypothetical protein
VAELFLVRSTAREKVSCCSRGNLPRARCSWWNFGITFLVIRGTALDKESKAYAESAIPAIASQWSEKALLDRAAPEFKQAVTIDRLDRMFKWFSRLGQLQKSEPAQGESNISLTPQTGKVVSGLYTSKAYFENGDATITLGLIKHGETWQISRFEVQSPYLASP